MWLGGEFAEFGLRWVVSLVFSAVAFMLGAWIFGRGFKRRIKALEARSSGISQTITVHGGVNIHNYDRQLRTAIEAETFENLNETVKRLPRLPLGDGHSYARLPNNTNIVIAPDGTMRLALPIQVSANFEGGLLGD